MFFHIVYNVHVMLDDIFLLLINIYGPQIVMYYLYAYYSIESGIKQLNWIEIQYEVAMRSGRCHLGFD